MSRPLPKHVEISEALIRRIAAGRIAEGERLPTERQMAADWGVAVGTLRKALAILDGRGFLTRVQGSGNYVRQGGAAGVYGLFRLELAEGGGLPRAEVLSLDRVAEGTRIRRLRRLDGIDVAAEEILWHGPGAPEISDLSDSLYLTWERLFGIRVDRVEDRVGIGNFPDWSPVAPGAVSGHVRRRSWAAGALVETSDTWFDAGKARFVSRAGGDG